MDARRVISRLGIVAVLLGAFIASSAPAQEVLLDGYRRVEGLMLFPALHTPNVYYYLPNRPAVATGKNGKPEFSFMRYAYTTDENRASSAGGIQEAGGGGILHFLVTYEVPEEEITKAARKLQEENEEAKIAGPIIFKSGEFALVTSFTDEEGKFTKRLCGVGKAPLIEGNRAAVSMELTKMGASLLWESFKMDTPDISLVFTMEVYAYRQPYEAEMRVHWDKVHHEEGFEVGAKVLVIGAEIEQMVDRLHQNGAIEIVTRGEHGTLDAIIEKANAKLLEIMFEKQPPTAPTPAQEPGLVDALLGAVTGRRGGGGIGSVFSAHASYKFRHFEETGTLVMNLNHYSSEVMTTVMAANIGDLHRRYGPDPSMFKTVTIDDPLYKQREIYVTIDGATAADFKDYINYVSVKLRKKHANGATTMDEIVLDAVKFNENKNSYRSVYPWRDDTDLEQWLTYEYKTVWNYRGGLRSESDWAPESTSVLAVAPTAVSRRISIEGDPDVLAEAGVRHVKLSFRYTIFGQPKTKQLTIRTREGSFPQTFDYIAEAANLNYTYDLTWVIGKETRTVTNVTDNAEVIYIDEIPEAEETSQ
ncbi:MAG: hypothetical protein JW889_10430 [Verrucomicrobia bacterium]|nr:hypothetical protein [Verrucomicrobiota bacterium]